MHQSQDSRKENKCACPRIALSLVRPVQQSTHTSGMTFWYQLLLEMCLQCCSASCPECCAAFFDFESRNVLSVTSFRPRAKAAAPRANLESNQPSFLLSTALVQTYRMTMNSGISSGGTRFSVRSLWLMVCAILVVSCVPGLPVVVAYRFVLLHPPAKMSVVAWQALHVRTFVLRAVRVVENGLARNNFVCCRMVDWVERTIGARRSGCRRAAALKTGSRVANEFMLSCRGVTTSYSSFLCGIIAEMKL